ncbi:cuticle protein AM1199-like [Panulirus ornatus]|uniref:cuticle protein AM1199-like n=1 Tax=Panulirus ornatus TaxID=150431 RepID=UPI003A8B90A5
MKLMVLACLASVAVAAPQHLDERDARHIAVLRDDRTDDGQGNYQYEFETENGISKSVVGRPGSAGGNVVEGFYTFTFPDGTVAEVRFTADENGFVAESPLIPETPAHSLQQIQTAEEQRRQGVTWDGQGRRLTR